MVHINSKKSEKEMKQLEKKNQNQIQVFQHSPVRKKKQVQETKHMQ